MKVSSLITEKILKDKAFRLNVALALGVSERNVQILATKGSDNLTKAAAVKYYQSAGFTEEQIFEDSEPIAYQSISNN